MAERTTFTFTNRAAGPRGIRGADGALAMIEPGRSATLEVDESELADVEASGCFAIGEGPAPGPALAGLAKAELLALAEAEGVAIAGRATAKQIEAAIRAAREG